MRHATVSQPKSLWGGEIGLIATLAILGLLCLYIAFNTIEPAYRFHMVVAVICAALGVYAIFKRYEARRGPSAARDQRPAEL